MMLGCRCTQLVEEQPVKSGVTSDSECLVCRLLGHQQLKQHMALPCLHHSPEYVIRYCQNLGFKV